jgi:hypothetical protein
MQSSVIYQGGAKEATNFLQKRMLSKLFKTVEEFVQKIFLNIGMA